MEIINNYLTESTISLLQISNIIRNINSNLIYGKCDLCNNKILGKEISAGQNRNIYHIPCSNLIGIIK
jgi:hypothetical protein